MKECTLHRDAVVRFGPFHAECPLCRVLRQTGELWQQAEDAAIAAMKAGSDEALPVIAIESIRAGVEGVR